MIQSPPAEVTPAGVKLRDPEDFYTARQAIYDGMREETSRVFPQSFGGVRLEATDIDYEDPEDFDIDTQKQALLQGKYLGRRLRGTLKLFDERTGEQLDEQRTTLMRVPHLTERGTFVHNGSEYTSMNQLRLMPGPYTRRKANGELETHFNIKRGTGSGFRVRFEPNSALYKLDIGQSQLRLYSLLHDIGVPDADLEKSWGKDVLTANRNAYDPRVFDKAYARLVKKPDPSATREQKVEALKAAFEGMQVHRRVAMKNLPMMFHDKQATGALPAASQGAGFKVPSVVQNSTTAPGLAPKVTNEIVVPNVKQNPFLAAMPKAPPARLQRVGFSADELYEAIRQPETGSQKNPWVKNPTSSAYGPVQLTSLLARDYLKRFPQQFNAEEQKFLNAHGQARGTWQATTPAQRAVYESATKKILQHIYNTRAGLDLDKTIKAWRGLPEDQDPNYYSAVRSALPTKRASYMPDWLQSTFVKLARLGAIVFLPWENGQYLLQRNGEDDRYPGKLRPPGGGKEKTDTDMEATIIRELNEEFDLPEDEVKDKIRYLGKDTRPEFKGTAVFELKDHGLEPGVYQASNDPEEVVVLEAAKLDDPDYNGPHRYKLA
jgi:8-oxo-dGTP pyrophosphatase MutT (NUDIX family)